MLEVIFLDDMELKGEGHYAITAVKDIKVTDSYLRLGQETTNCQTEEAKSDCLTRKLKEKVLGECGCAPFGMKSYYGAEVIFVAENNKVKFRHVPEPCLYPLPAGLCGRSET